ncbi:MAG: hypothetical protein QM610_01680 [Chitinophagaceae bacterium]
MKRVIGLFGKYDKLMVSSSKNKSYRNHIIIGRARTANNVNHSTSHNYQERDVVRPQDVATQQTGSFYVQLSEGVQKQGRIAVPMDSSFSQTPIGGNGSVSQEDIRTAYEAVKAEALSLLKF